MGPLHGIKIIEVVGLGAAPFCGMMLADMGAEVIRVDRRRAPPGEPPRRDPLARGRRSVALDLKNSSGVEALLCLVERADALFEAFRPGVAERLGFGPEVCLERNPRLVYGRLTGWGQEGPLAPAAGHDLNYIALSGALHSIGRRGEKPVPPLNLVGDFGGGGMLLAFGMVCALLETQRSGLGQVVDAAMVDGAAALMAMFFGFKATGMLEDATGSSFLAGAAHYYDTYQTRDGKYVAIAAIEPEFYDLLIKKVGLDRDRFGPHGFQGHPIDASRWNELKRELAEVFKRKTRHEWCQILEGTDACFSPVLSLSEAPEHPHNRARRTFIEIGGVVQHAPAPRFSRTLPETPEPPSLPGTDTEEVLAEWGFSEGEIRDLRSQGAIPG